MFKTLTLLLYERKIANLMTRKKYFRKVIAPWNWDYCCFYKSAVLTQGNLIMNSNTNWRLLVTYLNVFLVKINVYTHPHRWDTILIYRPCSHIFDEHDDLPIIVSGLLYLHEIIRWKVVFVETFVNTILIFNIVSTS